MSAASDQVRYVVLHHTGHGEDHFDLMYERATGETLTSWRLPNWPPRVGDVVESIGDHRRDYLEYEGEVSGNRGRVKRVKFGTARVEETINTNELHANDWTLKLHRPVPGHAWTVSEFNS